ncbi:MAG: hypothetical protein JJ863_29980 [Deltaproteobacteria bacterium]|nr:hypothetical protein [Deltaproteobacteria bacterium]
MTRALALGLFVCLGCGEAGDPDALSEDTTAPLAWTAGERFALVTVNRLTRDPLLGDPVCSINVQLGEANADGAFPAADTEGACVVGGALPELQSASFTALDGGTMDLRVGGTVDAITVDDTNVGSPLSFECARLESERSVGVTSLADESATDALGAFVAEIPLQAAPTFSEPEELRAGVALWPEGDIEVSWNGGLGDSVELVLMPRDGSAPMVRCFADDDGDFAIPARLADPYRAAGATLEVGRVGVEVRDVDGVEVRLASRSATQLWLELR